MGYSWLNLVRGRDGPLRGPPSSDESWWQSISSPRDLAISVLPHTNPIGSSQLSYCVGYDFAKGFHAAMAPAKGLPRSIFTDREYASSSTLQQYAM